jgi:aryl-alcohol dehydrogenase-like predicted oxidoreductase
VNFRFLGSSGLQVSEIVYGNWLTHGGQVEDDTATKCVQAALEVGITTFDTADAYAGGRAEEVLGAALKGQRREEIEILTKVYAPVAERYRNEMGLSRKHLRHAIEDSLRRLDTDYIDVYQAHRYDINTPLEETMQAFADIVHSGKALYVGVSEWTPEQLRAAHALAGELKFSLVSNQPQYNMLWRVIEDEVVPTCAELGLSQLVWSPIAGGALTGKYLPGQQAPEGSRGGDSEGAQWLRKWMKDSVLERVQKLVPIAGDLGLSLAQLAVAWVLQNKNVAGAIIGASRPQQVIDNVRAAGVTLTPDVLAAIDEALGDVVTRDPALVIRSTPPSQRG